VFNSIIKGMSKVNTYFENNIGRNILALQILVYYTNIAAIFNYFSNLFKFVSSSIEYN